MTPQNKKGLIVVLIVAACGFGYYQYSKSKGKKSKLDYAKNIVLKGKYLSGVDALMSFDEDFLKAWSSAVDAGSETFDYGGRKINTQGGRAVR